MVCSAEIGKAIQNDLLHMVKVFRNWLAGKASRILNTEAVHQRSLAAFLIGLALDVYSESRSASSDILRGNPGLALRQATPCIETSWQKILQKVCRRCGSSLWLAPLQKNVVVGTSHRWGSLVIPATDYLAVQLLSHCQLISGRELFRSRILQY